MNAKSRRGFHPVDHQVLCSVLSTFKIPSCLQILMLFLPTAQDRKKALGLKSHVRIISSHQPEHMLKSVPDKHSSFDSSKGQSPGQLSRDSSGLTGVESALLTDNFKELLLDPVEIQLQKLLGPDAEDFLHPTLREGAKKTLNPMVTQRKCM